MPFTTTKLTLLLRVTLGVFWLAQMLGCASLHQHHEQDILGFPVGPFLANEEIAIWLMKYDWVAWHSSDVVLTEDEDDVSRLGPEWFCLELDDRWHAIFGKYDSAKRDYQVVFHYEYSDDGEFIHSEVDVPQSTLNAYGRAIHRTGAQLPEDVTGLPIRFNVYVRPLGDDELEVWYLPAVQSDGTLVYGGELRYVVVSADGEIHTQELNYTNFFSAGVSGGAGGEKSLDIVREENEYPSVGDIFFLLMNRNHFEDITIWNRSFLTRLTGGDGELEVWLHARRQDRRPGRGAGVGRSRRPSDL